MKIIFMGTPEFSVPVLDALVTAGHDVVAAYCQPPRPAGRGKKDRPSPVQNRAEALGIPVNHPLSLKDETEQAKFTVLNADIAVVVAYGLILPQVVLNAPVQGCLNIHASLLPRWRGAAPIHRAILAGDAQTGICIMQMDAGLDTGPVLLRREITIGEQETTGELHNRLSDLGAVQMVEALAELDQLTPVAQPETGITYAAKVDKSEAQVDWARPAVEVDRLIRGLSPFPGAWCNISGERVKLLGSRMARGSGKPGQVMGGFTVACGQGSVEITRVQRSGKRAMDAAEMLLGLALPKVLD